MNHNHAKQFGDLRVLVEIHKVRAEFWRRRAFRTLYFFLALVIVHLVHFYFLNNDLDNCIRPAKIQSSTPEPAPLIDQSNPSTYFKTEPL